MKLGSKPEIFVLEDLTWLSRFPRLFSVVFIYDMFTYIVYNYLRCNRSDLYKTTSISFGSKSHPFSSRHLLWFHHFY